MRAALTYVERGPIMRAGPGVLAVGGVAAASNASTLAIVLLVIVIVSIGLIETVFQQRERKA